MWLHSHRQLCPLKSMTVKYLQTLHALHYSSNFRPPTGGGLITPGGHVALPEWWILSASQVHTSPGISWNTCRSSGNQCQCVLNTSTVSVFSWFNHLLLQVHLWNLLVWLTTITQITWATCMCEQTSSMNAVSAGMLSNSLAAWTNSFAAFRWWKKWIQGSDGGKTSGFNQ